VQVDQEHVPVDSCTRCEPAKGLLEEFENADSSLMRSTLSEGGLEMNMLRTPEKPPSNPPPCRPRPQKTRFKITTTQVSTPALEDNLLYNEFEHFGRGAWTVEAGLCAPASSSVANLSQSRPKSPKTRGKTQITLGSFLEFVKWADIVPRLATTDFATGIYQCVSRDSAVTGLDGQVGSLGWTGFQYSIGMIAALVGLTQVLGKDAFHLLHASGIKQFGIFPSQTAEQECEDGALSVFLECFATEKTYNMFSSVDHASGPMNKIRGMTLDQAIAVIRDLKVSPILIGPSIIAQEFRKVVRNALPDQRTSPRVTATIEKTAKLKLEQFRTMMEAIARRVGPYLLVRTVCVGISSRNQGAKEQRPLSARTLENPLWGLTHLPHKVNPKAFLRSSRPSSAPRGLRLSERPPTVVKAERFLKPAPPKWRPCGPVESQPKVGPTLTPSTMIGDVKLKGNQDFHDEEADLMRLQQDDSFQNALLVNFSSSGADSSAITKQSGNMSLDYKRISSESPGRALIRIENQARQDYMRMMTISNKVSLHESVTSLIDKSQSVSKSENARSAENVDDSVELHFPGGRVIRGGGKNRPEFVIPTAPPARSRHYIQGPKRLCPDPVFETAPVLREDETGKRCPRQGDMVWRRAHMMAKRASANAISAKKRMATRMGGVQPYCENGNWYMRSPSIAATAAGSMSQPLAQIEHGYRGDVLDGMLLRFRILEEARRQWPSGVGSTQDYAKWESREQLEALPHRGMW
jgi:hypothetical protein